MMGLQSIKIGSKANAALAAGIRRPDLLPFRGTTAANSFDRGCGHHGAIPQLDPLKIAIGDKRVNQRPTDPKELTSFRDCMQKLLHKVPRK
jgi:hypothetical protein